MPLNKINEESYGGSIGRSLGEALGAGGGLATGALMRHFQNKKLEQQRQQEAQQAEAGRRVYAQQTGTPFEATAGLGLKDVQGLNKGWAAHVPLRREQLSDIESKRAHELAKEGAKEAKDLKADQVGVSNLIGQIQEAQDLYKKTRSSDLVGPRLTKSKEYKRLESILESIGKNKFAKDNGLVIPSFDVGQDNFGPMLDMATVSLAEKYKLNNEVNVPAGQEGQFQQAAQLQGRPQGQQPLPASGEFRRPEGYQEPTDRLGNALGQLGGLVNAGISGAAGLPKGVANFIGSGADVVGLQKSPLLNALQEDLPSRQDVEQKLPFAPTGQESDEEKALRETAGDVGEQLLFGLSTGGLGTGLGGFTKVLKGIGMTQGAGNFAKWASKKLGAEEGTQDLVKAGTSLATAFIGAPTLKKQTTQKYNQLLESIPDNVHLDKKEQDAFGRAYNYFNKTGKGYGVLDDKLDKIGIGALTNKLPFKDAAEWVNELQLKDLGSKASKNMVKDLNKILKHAISSNKNIPDTTKRLLNDADTMYKSLKQSDKAWRFIYDKIGGNKSIKQGVTSTLTGIGLLGLMGGSQTALTGAAVGGGASALGSMAVAVKNAFWYPPVREAYSKMFKAALDKDGAKVVQHATALSKYINYALEHNPEE